jgi:hypothetical protein
MTIEPGATLTIPAEVTLTVEGYMYNHGTVINNGNIAVTGSNGVGGSIKNYDGNNDDVSGTLINNGSISISNQFGGNPAYIDNGSGEHYHGVFQNNGEITNGGTIINEHGSFENTPDGVLQNKTGATIDNENGELINSGVLVNEQSATIDNQNGEIINSGTLVNENGGVIDNSGGGAIYNSGTFTNDGSFSGPIPLDTDFAHIAVIAPIATQTYTGSALTPPVSLTAPVGITTDDYDVRYTNNIAVGTATVIVTGKGIYGGTKSATFTIIASPAGQSGDKDKGKDVKPGTGKAADSTKKPAKVTKPKKTSFKKVTAGKKKLTLKWKKVSGITKYQVRYKVKGTKKWKTKTVSAKKTTLVIKGLKKGKKYQVQIRSYKTANKANYYSAWSKTKTSKKVK